MRVVPALCAALFVIGCGGGDPSTSSETPPTSGSGNPSAPTGPSPSTSSPTPAVLPTPVGASVTQATNIAISIKWEAAQGAVDYRVMRGSQQVVLAEDTQTRFRDTDLAPATVYNYTIDALGTDGRVIRKMSVSGVTNSGPAEYVAADVPPSDVTKARSLTTSGWTPNPAYDTCSKALHDAHWTFGPDDKAYPTWHPPVYEFANGSLCRFGHEHGQDQRASRLYGALGPIPFGYVNEQLAPDNPSLQRNEDHFGHKVALFNGIKELTGSSGLVVGSMECDILFKLHQGTYSADALKNNTHERFLNYKCPNGLEIRYKSLQPFGMPNSFLEEASNQFSNLINTTGATPANQPSGASRRIVPSILAMTAYIASNGRMQSPPGNCDNCAGTSAFTAEMRKIGIPEAYYLSTYNSEVWQGGPTHNVSNSRGQIFKFEGGPYWVLMSSARYFDPLKLLDGTLISRQIDLCYSLVSLIYNSADCKLARSRSSTPLSWESPLSPFNGAIRANETNHVALYNPSPSRERIFFDPYGQLSLINDDVPLTRTAQHPIRGYFRSTGSQTIGTKLSNWGGSVQCGGNLCYTNFNWYKLKNGQVIDSGVHAPN